MVSGARSSLARRARNRVRGNGDGGRHERRARSQRSTRAAQRVDQSLRCSGAMAGVVGGARPSVMLRACSQQSTRAAQHVDQRLQCGGARAGVVGGARPSMVRRACSQQSTRAAQHVDQRLQCGGARAGVVGRARPSMVLRACSQQSTRAAQHVDRGPRPDSTAPGPEARSGGGGDGVDRRRSVETTQEAQLEGERPQCSGARAGVVGGARPSLTQRACNSGRHGQASTRTRAVSAAGRGRG